MIRSSLITLGLPSPAVTADMKLNDRVYHEELAKELGAVLSTLMIKPGKGIVGLDEIWCIWNRARGIGSFFDF